MAQPFLNDDGRAMMSKVTQQHTSPQVIYAHQPPASHQGTTLWVKESCAKDLCCFINKSERVLGLKAWFTVSFTPRSTKISFTTCRSLPLSNTLTHTLAQTHPHQARPPPACAICLHEDGHSTALQQPPGSVGRQRWLRDTS